MTRQPAAEKRFTVACPIPRLAPVSSSVRRGWFGCGAVVMPFTLPYFDPATFDLQTLASESRPCRLSALDRARRSGVKPRFAPRRAALGAAELDALVQPEWAVLPEFDGHWNDPKPRPIRRPGHAADGIFGGIARDGLLEGKPAFEWRRLIAGPGADLREPRAAGIVGISFGVGDALDRTAKAHLPGAGFPVKQQRGLGVVVQLAPLLAVHVGVE